MEKIKEGESQKREDVLLPMYKKNVSTLGKSNVRKNPSTVAFYRSCSWG